MKRWLLLTVAIVAVSAGMTVAVQYLPAGPATNSLPFGNEAADDPNKPRPIAEVDGTTVHEFGRMPQQTKGGRIWKIKNTGNADLVLTGGHPACSCTLLNLKDGESHTVKPGEAFDLNVEWETRLNSGRYSKNASLYTNDPNRPELVFVVQGEVQPAIITIPNEDTMDMGDLPNEKPHEFYVVLGSPDRPDFKITGVTTSRPELFETDVRELSKEERIAAKMPQGYRLTIKVKQTGALGNFLEELMIRTDHPVRPEIHRAMAGKVIGPVNVMPALLKANDAKPNEEITGTIWVTGQDSTTFTVAKVPGKLKVTIAPDDEKNKSAQPGQGHAYRITLAIPAGTPPGVISEDVVLKTNHPRAAELKVPVYIQVLGD